ncbi:MAG: ArsC family reductase [Thiohalophilus sp.]|jgi:arsenate reductase
MLNLYGIKNCDTVKKARKWLDAHGVKYTFVDLKQTVPAKARLQRWSKAVGWETLLNRRGQTWRQLEDKQKQDITAARALDLMHEFPMLIKRPVIEDGDQVLVGFKEADYQQYFG